MRKLLKTMKTLLIAAGLLVGTSNAWGETYLNTMTGTLQSGGFQVNRSKVITIAKGESLTYTFVNTSVGSAIFNNWVVEARDVTTTYCCNLRGDAHPGGEHSGVNAGAGYWTWDNGTSKLSGSYTGSKWSDIDGTAASWLSNYSGVTVTLTINYSNDGTTLTMTHSGTVNNSAYTGTYTVSGFEGNNINVFLSNEYATQTITNVSYTDAESSVTNYSPVYERGFTTAWAASDITTTADTKNKWYCANGISNAEGNSGMRLNTNYGLENHARGNNTNTAILNLDRSKDIVTVDAVWNVGNTDKTPQYAGYTQFQYGDLKVTFYPRSLETSYTINGKKTTVTNAAQNDALTIHIKVNSVSGSISEFYINNGSTTLAQFSDLTASNNAFADGANYDKITSISSHNASSVSVNSFITSLIVTEETSAATYSTVTFHYATTDDTDLSATRADFTIENVEDGTSIEGLIADSYKTTFYSGDENTRYTYSTYSVSDDATEVNGDVTVTLKFTAAVKFTRTVQAVDGEENVLNASLAEGSAYAGDNVTLYWNKYIYANSKWWVCTSYGDTYTTDGTTSISYTESDIDNFFEAENMQCSRTYGNQNNNTDYSNGGGTGVYQSATLTAKTTIPAGTYTIGIGSVTRTASKDQNYTISYSTDGISFTDTGKKISFNTTEGSSEKYVENVGIPAAAFIRLTNSIGNNAYDYVDYVYAKRTGDATINAAISDAGAATFVSNYALDFTNVEDLQAYIATEQNGASITFDQVTGAVPANTPLLLRGATADIPVAASAEAVGTNLLVAGTGAEIASQVGDKYNFILNKIDDVVGFYKAAGQTVATNRAYLSLSDNPFVGGAKSVTMVFNGETTGITTVAAPASKAVVRGTYNMQGQRVQNPSKGLYIVDGKKVAIN